MYSRTINFPQVTVSDILVWLSRERCFDWCRVFSVSGNDWDGAEELDFLRDLCYIILL